MPAYNAELVGNSFAAEVKRAQERYDPTTQSKALSASSLYKLEQLTKVPVPTNDDKGSQNKRRKQALNDPYNAIATKQSSTGEVHSQKNSTAEIAAPETDENEHENGVQGTHKKKLGKKCSNVNCPDNARYQAATCKNLWSKCPPTCKKCLSQSEKKGGKVHVCQNKACKAVLTEHMAWYVGVNLFIGTT